MHAAAVVAATAAACEFSLQSPTVLQSSLVLLFKFPAALISMLHINIYFKFHSEL